MARVTHKLPLPSAYLRVIWELANLSRAVEMAMLILSATLGMVAV
jgi:hypothetical protein